MHQHFKKIKISKLKSPDTFYVSSCVWVYGQVSPVMLAACIVFCCSIRFFSNWINCNIRNEANNDIVETVCLLEPSYSRIVLHSSLSVYPGIHANADSDDRQSDPQYYRMFNYLLPIIIVKASILFQNDCNQLERSSISYSAFRNASGSSGETKKLKP